MHVVEPALMLLSCQLFFECGDLVHQLLVEADHGLALFCD
jgi:hypothetical protein